MNTLPTPALGMLYTLGYAAAGSVDVLEEVMTASEVLVVDIRLRPRSRWWPVWNKKQLREHWESRYTHEKQLGNVNYQEKTLPVQLAGPHVEDAIAGLAVLLVQGYSVVLLCACKEYDECHRKVVAEMIVAEMGANDGTANA